MADNEQTASSGERIVRANGVDLCVETFGAPDAPAILLLAGMGGSLDWWEDTFCRRLAAAGRQVIRYDYRDTGRSTHYPAGTPQYRLSDLAADAVGILDALGIGRAHFVGLSMGGWLSQLIALDYPDRVASLTLIATRPTGSGEGDPDLPEVSAELAASFAEEAPPTDWSDRAAAIDAIVAGERAFARSQPFDEAGKREIAARVVERTADLEASMTNHFAIEGNERWRERLGAVAAPTLVLHGTEDPLFPLGNGEALAREIPGARLVALAGMGHEYPPREVWDTVIPAIVAHTAS